MRHMSTPSLKLSKKSAPPGSSGTTCFRNGSPTRWALRWLANTACVDHVMFKPMKKKAKVRRELSTDGWLLVAVMNGEIALYKGSIVCVCFVVWGSNCTPNHFRQEPPHGKRDTLNRICIKHAMLVIVVMRCTSGVTYF